MQSRTAARLSEPPVKTSDRVYEAMKEEIITGQLPPGSIISELTLAERYQTSRTPVREACQFLQKDGLLEAVPHKGFFVAEITMKQVQDIYQLRLVLEGTCARIAAEKITRSELQELEALGRPITFTASNQQSFRRSTELNRRFHLRIAEITGNQELIKILSNILDKITRAQYLEAKKAPMVIGPEHEEVVRAIKGRDPTAAEKAMVTHIQNSLDRLLNVIFSSKFSS
jgi:DNA-binding GntR family transcriptional regulator